MASSIPFSARTKRLVETAVRIAREGLAERYHPSLLLDSWRRAAPEHWSRLALLAGLSPEDATDGVLRAATIDRLESLTQTTHH